jgi:hypothetical protein
MCVFVIRAVFIFNYLFIFYGLPGSIFSMLVSQKHHMQKYAILEFISSEV